MTPATLGQMFALDRTGPGQWAASMPPDWSGWTGPHGGALAAILTEVATELADPESAVHACDMRFLGKPEIGDCEVRATPSRIGRSLQSVEVTAFQRGQTVASACVMLGPVRGDQTLRLQSRSAPAVPGPDACDPGQVPQMIKMLVPAGVHFDLRPAGGSLPLTGADEARMIAWIGLLPELPVSPAALMILADALPPGIFPVLSGPLVVPTVQLSVHLHAPAAGLTRGPVLVDARNVSTGGGWSIDEADIFDTAGTLIAQARQLRRVLGAVDLPAPSADARM